MTVVVGKGSGAKPRKPRVRAPRPSAGNTPRGQQPVHTAPTHTVGPVPKVTTVKHSTPKITGIPRGTEVRPSKVATRPTHGGHKAYFGHTGRNPRNVAILPNKVKPPTGRAGDWSLLPKISIHNPESGRAIAGRQAEASLSSIGTIGLHAISDAFQLIPSSIEGLGTIGAAVGEDAYAGLVHGWHNHGSVAPRTAALAKSAWRSSVTKSLLEGNLHDALAKFKAHPLDAVLEFAGEAGIVGRVAGAAARTGALGERAASIASTAREGRELAAGLPTEHRTYSPNVFKKGAQVAGERAAVKLPDSIKRAINDSKLNKRVDIEVGAAKHINRAHLDKQAAAERASIKGDHRFHTPAERKAAVDVAQYITNGIATRDNLVKDLGDYKRQLQRALAKRGAKMKKADREAAETHVANIERFEANPSVKAVVEIANDYNARQTLIEAELQSLKILTPEQTRMSPMLPPVAAGKLKAAGIRVAKSGDVSVRSALLRRAASSAKGIVHDGRVDAGRLDAAEAAVRDALADARRESDQLPAGPRDTYLRAAEDAEGALQDARRLAAKGNDEAAAAKLEVAASKLAAAKAAATKLDKHEKRYLAPVVRTIKLASGKQAVRRVSAGELERELRKAGIEPADLAYMNLKRPKEEGEPQSYVVGRSLSRGDSKLRRRTASGIPEGRYLPGFAGLSDSQRLGINLADRAKAFDDLMKSVAVHDSVGNIAYYSRDAAEEKARELEADTGVSYTAVPLTTAGKSLKAREEIRTLQEAVMGWKPGEAKGADFSGVGKDVRFGLVPTTAVERYLEHLKVDRANYGSKWGTVTRQFRNTVLPFSPKWITGNVVEAMLRSALVGATPTDAALARRVLTELRAKNPDAADRLEAVMGGLHYGMAHDANPGVLSKAEHVTDRNVLTAARMIAFEYRRVVQGIYDGNRALERYFEQAVVGAHMRDTLRSFGHTWLEASLKENAWYDRLADAYADPRMARAATETVHKVLGQYDSFSPNMKWLINNLMPFLPWYVNAVRFVFWTMPADHPLAQTTLNLAAQVAAKEFMQQQHALGDLAGTFMGIPTDALMTDIMTPSGGYIDAARYTPWGFGDEGPISTITAPIFPQVQGPFLNLFGLDAFGNQLQRPGQYEVKGQGARMAVALNSLAMSLLGPLGVLDRAIAGHGNTLYSGSTLFTPETKPDTHHGGPGILGGFERTLLPGFPTYLHRNTPGADSIPPGWNVQPGTTFNSTATPSGKFKVTKGATFGP